MNDVYEHIGLPPNDLEDFAAHHTRSYETIDPHIKEKLDSFFAPYNQQLSLLLQDVTNTPLDETDW